MTRPRTKRSAPPHDPPQGLEGGQPPSALRPPPSALLLALLLLSGCVTGSGGSAIRELHLFGVPVAVNMDQTPGADGFAVRVYASNGRAASGVPIKTGKLEIQLFDGGKPESGHEPAKPLRVWTYDAAQLKAHAARSSIGWGYRFAPAWGEARPTRDHLTVVVRYLAPSGEALSSSPSVIAMTLK